MPAHAGPMARARLNCTAFRDTALSSVSAVTVRWHLSIGRREMARVLEGGGLS